MKTIFNKRREQRGKCQVRDQSRQRFPVTDSRYGEKCCFWISKC